MVNIYIAYYCNQFNDLFLQKDRMILWIDRDLIGRIIRPEIHNWS